MPVPDFPNLNNLEASGKRKEFVLWVKQTLASLTGDDNRALFVPGLWNDMHRAWRDAPEKFDDLADAVVHELLPDQVQRHGLAGPQLDFKLATVRHWAEQCQQRRNSHTLRRLLDAIDNLLESLLDAIGAGSTLKELKDAIRDALAE